MRQTLKLCLYNMTFDALIIGGGVAGMQCALILGSANKKEFAKDKNIGVIINQKSSHLKNALFNNVLGLQPKTLGKDILIEGKEQLRNLNPHINQLENEKVISVDDLNGEFKITTNKGIHFSKIVIIALNYSKPFSISGLEYYIKPHTRANSAKDRIQLKNDNHLVKPGIYCCGTIAGWRSQFAIAAGSGASVATDILTLWNDGNHVKIHDKI